MFSGKFNFQYRKQIYLFPLNFINILSSGNMFPEFVFKTNKICSKAFAKIPENLIQNSGKHMCLCVCFPESNLYFNSQENKMFSGKCFQSVF